MKSTRHAYFDCFSGISGDMVLGALVDAGADLRAIEAELRKLNLPGWTISAQKVQRRAIFATHVKVEVEGEEEQGAHAGKGENLASGVKTPGKSGVVTSDLKVRPP